MSDMHVEYKNVSDLIPYVNNSRTHSDEQIAQIASSIKEFKFRNPVLIDEDGGIIAGHGRVLAARKLNLDTVPCIVLDGLTEAQKKAYVIADNKLALNAGWDNEVLGLELKALDEMDFDLSLTGFDAEELASFMNEPTVGLTDEDAVPDVPESPVTVDGDVWLLGDHRLMCGDSTSIDAVEKLLDGQKADCVVTDPPYNQETDGGSRGEIGKSLRKQGADIEHLCNFEPDALLGILPSAHRSRVMNATVFCNKDLVPQYLTWAQDAGYAFNILIWKKPSAIPLGGSYQPDVEYMLVFRKSAKFNTKQSGVTYSKVLAFDRETGLHPTMKPVGLLENQIKIVSDASDIVLDLFGGSGSTLIACEKTGRKNRSMELDPKYCDVIIKRWQDFTGKQAVHADTGLPFGVQEAAE